MAWTAGTRVGPYEIVDVLGDGGMGKVFRVRHLISDRVEAMKVLLSATSANQEMLGRFTREIRVLAGLNHPNIAALYTAFHHNDQMVMIMEYVEGMDLRRQMLEGITLDEAVLYTRQILMALNYAHSRNVIHRDIKPSNIMVTPDGRIKLLDFGLALAMPDPRLTMTGALLGSMHYIAPEQISGEESDVRSDMYGVGVTLYEMATGRLPFEGASYPQVIAAHLRNQVASPSGINPQIPPEFSAVVMKALEKDRGQRWQTAREFLTALERSELGQAAQMRVSTLHLGDGSALSGPSAREQFAPEQLSLIALKLANYVGPIANILVKRASTSSQDLKTLVEQVAGEIESEEGRRMFLASVQGQLRGSGFFSN
jgi:eukaryotic-like serine/threonine-protein kinase